MQSLLIAIIKLSVEMIFGNLAEVLNYGNNGLFYFQMKTQYKYMNMSHKYIFHVFCYE